MKLIIDIPEETYDYWKEHKHEYVLSEAIANGIPYNPTGDNSTRLIDANALLEVLEQRKRLCSGVYGDLGGAISGVIKLIDNTPTVEPMESEYGAIQYSNGFNDGFTTAKDTIIHNIAKQYSKHNELVPEWLSIGDLKGGETKK